MSLRVGVGGWRGWHVQGVCLCVCVSAWVQVYLRPCEGAEKGQEASGPHKIVQGYRLLAAETWA